MAGLPAPISRPLPAASSGPGSHRSSSSWTGSLLVQPLVDAGDLGDPPLTRSVVELHDLVVRPMKVKSHVRFLLVQPVIGVAPHSPNGVDSTSNSPAQCGQETRSRLWPFWFMRW